MGGESLCMYPEWRHLKHGKEVDRGMRSIRRLLASARTTLVDDHVGPYREGHAAYPGDGHRVQPGALVREGLQVGHVLADRDAGAEQHRMRGSRQVPGVIYVERINADEGV